MSPFTLIYLCVFYKCQLQLVACSTPVVKMHMYVFSLRAHQLVYKLNILMGHQCVPYRFANFSPTSQLASSSGPHMI